MIKKYNFKKNNNNSNNLYISIKNNKKEINTFRKKTKIYLKEDRKGFTTNAMSSTIAIYINI